MTRLLESCIRGLIAQDYTNIQGIIVTVPTVNMRGQVFSEQQNETLQAFMRNDSFKLKNVVFHRPAFDKGPMMKYLGAYPYIKADAGGGDTYFFICDDDQVYPPTFISSYVSILEKLAPQKREKAVVGCTNHGLLGKIHPSFRAVMGLRGILLPSAAIVKLHDKIKPLSLPTCCAMNDDTFISLMLYKLGYSFITAPSCSTDIENNDVDGLSKSYGDVLQKPIQQIQCHARFNTSMCCVLVVCTFSVCLAVATAVALPILVVRKHKNI